MLRRFLVVAVVALAAVGLGGCESLLAPGMGMDGLQLAERMALCEERLRLNTAKPGRVATDTPAEDGALTVGNGCATLE